MRRGFKFVEIGTSVQNEKEVQSSLIRGQNPDKNPLLVRGMFRWGWLTRFNLPDQEVQPAADTS